MAPPGHSPVASLPPKPLNSALPTSSATPRAAAPVSSRPAASSLPAKPLPAGLPERPPIIWGRGKGDREEGEEYESRRLPSRGWRGDDYDGRGRSSREDGPLRRDDRPYASRYEVTRRRRSFSRSRSRSRSPHMSRARSRSPSRSPDRRRDSGGYRDSREGTSKFGSSSRRSFMGDSRSPSPPQLRRRSPSFGSPPRSPRSKPRTSNFPSRSRSPHPHSLRRDRSSSPRHRHRSLSRSRSRSPVPYSRRRPSRSPSPLPKRTKGDESFPRYPHGPRAQRHSQQDVEMSYSSPNSPDTRTHSPPPPPRPQYTDDATSSALTYTHPSTSRYSAAPPINVQAIPLSAAARKLVPLAQEKNIDPSIPTGPKSRAPAQPPRGGSSLRGRLPGPVRPASVSHDSVSPASPAPRSLPVPSPTLGPLGSPSARTPDNASAASTPSSSTPASSTPAIPTGPKAWRAKAGNAVAGATPPRAAGAAASSVPPLLALSRSIAEQDAMLLAPTPSSAPIPPIGPRRANPQPAPSIDAHARTIEERAAREAQLQLEKAAREAQLAKEKEAREALFEQKKRQMQLNRWLPKGVLKVVPVNIELETEIDRVRTARMTTILTANLESALALRAAHSALSQVDAEREAVKDRKVMALGGLAGGILSSLPLGVGLSGGM